MQHVFIINPKAGNATKSIADIKSKINAVFAKKSESHSIYVTEYAGHERAIAEAIASSGEDVRIYAVGGDGTLNNVVDGIYKYPNASVTAIPCGSGNDFVKLCGRSKNNPFFDIEKVVDGEEKLIDIYSVGDARVGVNIGSVGFDATICAKVNKFTRFLPGKTAYMLSLLICLFTQLKNPFKIIVESDNGKHTLTGSYLLCAVANGKYYGGSFYPAPYAKIDDGLLDFTFISSVSPFSILSLLDKYKKGTYIKELSHLVTYMRGTRVEISGNENVAVQFDGNVEYSEKAVFEIIPKALRFVFPKGALQQ